MKIRPSLLLLLSMLPLMGTVQDFEAPTYQKDGGVEGIEGWTGTAAISAEESSSGDQSLKLESGASASHTVSLDGVTFLDLSVLPAFHDETPEQADLDLLGAEVAFVKQGTVGTIMVKGLNGAWQETTATIPLVSGAPAAGEWVRLTLRLDPEKKAWDLYVDGLPLRANLPLAADAKELQFHGGSAPLYVDVIQWGADNPLFADTDRDGIPDVEEKAGGLNAYADDRAGDVDGDGISNIEEFFASGRNTGNDEVSKGMVFVDNASGSDANTGRRSYAMKAADGPLASIKVAMEKAPTGSTIVVLPGRGIYEEGSRDAQGKALTIKTIAPVIIK